ncbi:MAG: thioredoxin domain-containing protein, partial [Deltaproteobacteria bacterium]|nr:thioredoxin domain-containing protein [Deltaproteobacteria bacterium]
GVKGTGVPFTVRRLWSVVSGIWHGAWCIGHRVKTPCSMPFALCFFLFTVHCSLTTVVYAYTHDTSLIKWMEYSPEAFDRAKKEGKPIFMVISAVWCYWCHVYEEKTLESKEVAEYINTNYIPIFIDYDRRKDIAARYPAAGLPTTVIFAPGGEEVVSSPGYIPKEKLLQNLQLTLKYIREEFKPSAEARVEEPPEKGIIISTKDDLSRVITGFENILNSHYDPVFGGIGLREKEPRAEIFKYLLEVYEANKDKKILEKVTTTLDYMAGMRQKPSKGKRPGFDYLSGLYKEKDKEDWLDKIARLQQGHKIVGIYDPVEGGFFRYATRRDWTIPHYEKMLADNGELIRLYLHAYKVTNNKRYREMVVKSLEYILKNLYDPKDGRFHGSQDADEIYYHLTLEERKKVGSPRVDKTSYTATNANAIITFLYAGDVLRDNRYKEIAIKALSFFSNKMITGDGVLSYYDGEKKQGFLNGQMEDNAWMVLAFLEGYGYTKDKRWLDRAEGLLGYILERLYDSKNGGFYERRSTSREYYREGELFLKNKPYNLNGIMAYTLIRAYGFTKKEDYLKRARETMGAFQGVDPISPYFQKVAGYLLKKG